MKSPHEAAITRMYPHLVTSGTRKLGFTNIEISSAPLARRRPGRFTFDGVGMLDAAGDLTAEGRSVIDEAMAVEARTCVADMCVVWGPDDCTWYDRDGSRIPGRSPPRAAETLNAGMYDRLPVELEDCWTFPLPEGSDLPNLCVMRIDRTRIEIAAGAPVILGWFDETPIEGERDQAEALLGPDGLIVPPARFRGQPVLDFENGDTLFGPVQPEGEGIVLRHPWPKQIRDACRRIAGRDVDEAIVRRIFEISQPRADGMNVVGVLEAA